MQHSAQQQADCSTPERGVNFNFTDHIKDRVKEGRIQRMKVKLAYGCQIKMAKKSEEEEEDKNNPEKRKRQ